MDTLTWNESDDKLSCNETIPFSSFWLLSLVEVAMMELTMTVTLWQLKDLMLVKDAILLSQPRPGLGGILELQVFQSDFPQAPERNKNLPFHQSLNPLVPLDPPQFPCLHNQPLTVALREPQWQTQSKSPLVP